VSIVFSSKFLISPIIGSLILTVSSMELILIIDILTLVITVMAIFSVRKCLSVKSQVKKKLDFFKDLKEGWMIILEFGTTASIPVIIMSGF
jgi:MFS transporter, DHA3 family, macrolide efflux protein